VKRTLFVILGVGVVALTVALLVTHHRPVVVTATAHVEAGTSPSSPLVQLMFSSPVTIAKLPPLTLSPAITTQWHQVSPTEVSATVSGSLPAIGRYRITVPTALSCATTCTVTHSGDVVRTLSPDVTFEDQLLAELHYLPVTFTPTTPSTDLTSETPGTFSWRFPALAPLLASQWSVGASNVVLSAGLMRFQGDHGLPTTGNLDPTSWHTLVVAAAKAEMAGPYAYVDVTEHSPETLTLYSDGAAIFHTLVNTGIAQAPSSLGTYPVYLRFISQTMRGTNPDGSTYVDPGIPWVSYFHGGEALHGYIRASYGFEQSLGCVEMPFASAQTVWPHTPIGTLVTVRP